jgi:hypothetical protein
VSSELDANLFDEATTAFQNEIDSLSNLDANSFDRTDDVLRKQ